MLDNLSLMAVLVYCTWTLFLLGSIAALRSMLTANGTKLANSFAVGGDDISQFSGRLCRAHANCYENLPVFLGIIFVAYSLRLTAVTDAAALWLVAARIAQSTVHLISTSVRAVQLRFIFFLVQFLIIFWWASQLLIAIA